jgi:hypothetical protein
MQMANPGIEQQSEPAQHEDGPQANSPDLGNYVSRDLDDAEYAFVRAHLNKLPDAMKQKILRTDLEHFDIFFVDGTTGAVHANRPDLAGGLTFNPDAPLPGDEYPGELLATQGDIPEDNSVPQTTSCGSIPFPGCTAGGGPYRRIFTTPVTAEVTCPSGVVRPCTGTYAHTTNTGYYVGGTVTTACNAGSLIHSAKQEDGGYSFLGGWSATPKEKGSDIDAGLHFHEVTAYLDEYYTLFIKIPGYSTIEITKSTDPPGDRTPADIDCGKETQIEFRVAPWPLDFGDTPECKGSATVPLAYMVKACQTVAFIAERGFGGVGSQYNEQAIVWVAPSVTFGGWGTLATSTQGVSWGGAYHQVPAYWPQAPCGGCIFKWMTAIAQSPQNLDDGSNYTATWSDRSIAQWAFGPDYKGPIVAGYPYPMTKDLTRCSEYPLWSDYNPLSVISDCGNTPVGLSPDNGRVHVTDYSVIRETDTINLKNP